MSLHRAGSRSRSRFAEIEIEIGIEIGGAAAVG